MENQKYPNLIASIVELNNMNDKSNNSHMMAMMIKRIRTNLLLPIAQAYPYARPHLTQSHYPKLQVSPLASHYSKFPSLCEWQNPVVSSPSEELAGLVSEETKGKVRELEGS